MAEKDELEGDVYKDGSEEDLMENDEITAAEAGFISGYNESNEEEEVKQETEEEEETTE